FSVFLSERGLLIKPMRDTRGTFATTRTGIGLISRLCTMQHAPEDSTRTLPGVRSGLCQRVRAISSDSRKHGKIKNTHFLASGASGCCRHVGVAGRVTPCAPRMSRI